MQVAPQSPLQKANDICGSTKVLKLVSCLYFKPLKECPANYGKAP